MQKFECLENQNNFLNEIKTITRTKIKIRLKA